MQTQKILKNYERGVWTLPPSLRLKDKDKEKYLAIGESDGNDFDTIFCFPSSKYAY